MQKVNSLLKTEGKTLCTEAGKFLTFLAQISCCCALMLDAPTSAPLTSTGRLNACIICTSDNDEVITESYAVTAEKQDNILPEDHRKMSWG